MSKAIVKASSLKPEIRLAQAVSQFEADLSDKQKSTFRNLKSQTLATAPCPSDVMRLTAEIDLQLSGRRCIGPRFTNFLQGVQQFAALADVIVGGSQNIIACGVWSLVRMSLLSVVNLSTYIERLSTLFMDIGRSAPRYNAMALLYPQSKALQSQLIEYFIVVVSLCHHLLQFTQKSELRKITSTLNDSKLRNFQADLDRWAAFIKDEVQMTELQESSKFRALSSKFSKSTSHQQKVETNLRVLDMFSRYDHETAWKQTRKVGNASVFTLLTEYKEWKMQTESCTLLWAGKLGSGKSVLLANIVDDLSVHVKADDITIAYFFCRYDLPESLRARTIVGSIARQLLCTAPDLSKVAELYNREIPSDDLDNLIEGICQGFSATRKVFLVLDGVDECSEVEKLALMNALQMLQSKLNLLLCVSFRLEPNNGLEMLTESLIASRTALVPENNPDIDKYIKTELEQCLVSRKLVIGDPALILDIEDALLKGSQGMFLWVALQIQGLCGMKTDQAIKEALLNLPRDLSETFVRILSKSKCSGQSYQTQILHLVLAAERPLITEELREALSVVPGNDMWDPAKLLNDVNSALACCGCLIMVDEEENTVRFVHHSVKQFLLDTSKDIDGVAFTTGQAQSTMADIVVTYMNYGTFGTELSRAKVPQVRVELAPTNIIRATLGDSNNVQKLALSLLKFRGRSEVDISKILAESRKSFQSQIVDDHRFYAYARQYWFGHIFYISAGRSNMKSLFNKLIDRHGREVKLSPDEHWMSLVWAIENGNIVIAESLLKISGEIMHLWSMNGQSPLEWAVTTGNAAVAKFCIHSTHYRVDIEWDSLLILAIEHQHESIVSLLLSIRVEGGRSPKKIWDRTPLSRAVALCNQALVRLILDSGEFDVNETNEDNTSPLYLALYLGHDGIAELLIQTRMVDLNASCLGITPLYMAVKHNRKRLVQSMLGIKDLDPNQGGPDRYSPLALAVLQESQSMVRLLLTSTNVDVNRVTKERESPLLFAVAQSDFEMVKLLLERHTATADFSGPNSPVLLALEKEDRAIAELLLDGTSIVLVDRGCDRASILSIAAEKGCAGVVKKLVDIYDVNEALVGGFEIPLLSATKNGHSEVVSLLLASGSVAVDQEDDGDMSPLRYAAVTGHGKMITNMLSSGKLISKFPDQVLLGALTLAVANEHDEVVKVMLEHPRYEICAGTSLLQICKLAMGLRNPAIVLSFLETGRVEPNSKDENGIPILVDAIDYQLEPVIQFLLQTGMVDFNNFGDSRSKVLEWAILNNNEEIVKILLASPEFDVNLKLVRGTPLIVAVTLGAPQMVKLLLETGRVDVNLTDGSGRSAISRAVIAGDVEITELLLETGKVDLNSSVSDEMRRPAIFAAVASGNVKLVKLLLDTGQVDVNLVDKNGWSMIFMAVATGNVFVTRLLLSTGQVDLSLKDKDGRTALQLAAKSGHRNTVKVLRTYVAEEEALEALATLDLAQED